MSEIRKLTGDDVPAKALCRNCRQPANEHLLDDQPPYRALCCSARFVDVKTYFATIEGRPDCVKNEVCGFRDVYWCWLRNEPGFPTYGGPDGKEHICSECRNSIEGLEDEHTFIAHIKKPVTEPQ